LAILKDFYRHTQDPGFYIEGIGDNPDYEELLANYYKVTKVLLGLDPKYQSVIIGICKDMGAGMAQFAEKKIQSKDDYDQYCYYVAGLVGLGLSQLFSVSGIESDDLKDQEELAVSMGLFLQKTNIIRDYYEDLLLSRTFWPEGIWKKYANHLEDFACEPKSINSLGCLNHMVTDALGHASDCIAYLNLIKDPLVFRFCAIPQVMAIATLAEVYNNPKTLTQSVKIRKGLAAKMIVGTTHIDEVKKIFSETASRIFKKIDLRDPNCSQTVERLRLISTGSQLPLATPTPQINQDNERSESKQPSMV